MLAAEWVGTALADWIGLRTLRLAVMEICADDEIPLGNGRWALPGPAIVSRAEPGTVWGGTIAELRSTENYAHVAELVVFDTWTRNCDRHPPAQSARQPNYDNVFLSSDAAPPGRFFLMAIDHSHCFDCGRALTTGLRRIEKVKDTQIYGRFPEFDPFLRKEDVATAVDRLLTVPRAMVEDLAASLPAEWEVPTPVRSALASLICDRADFLAGTLVATLFP